VSQRSPAQAFARIAPAPAVFPQSSGVPALESAGALSEKGALTEGIAALTAEVPALAH
jgi:hypothetical protein